jgi:hypothetical protein
MLGMLALIPLANRAPTYARLLWGLVRDERTPAARKAMLGGALGYIVLGRDIVPDEIDRAAFDGDIARLRRILPGPIRRVVRRLPGMIGAAGQALQHSGLGPRLRAWITKEGSIA